MITGYNFAERTLTIGIRDLIDFGRLPDTLVPSENPLNVNKRKSIHSGFQRTLEKEGWQKEIPVKLRLEVLGITFDIRGRLDLFRESDGILEMIEVKTITHKPAFEDPIADRIRHVLQLCFYARAFSSEHDITLQAIRPSLVYLSMDTKKPGRHDYPIDPLSTEVEQAWQELLHGTATYLDEEDTRKKKQFSALRDFSFPYDVFRVGQKEMVDDVSSGIIEEGYLIIQAPTGTGKTVAVLVGALKETLTRRLTLFFLTAKNTHKSIVRETLRLIIGRGLPLRAMFITAKEKVCLRGRSSCLPDDCPYASDFGRKVRDSGVMRSLLNLQVIGPEKLVEMSENAGVCPFELGLCLSTHCDVIICDYNYVFDPHVYLKRFFMEKSTSLRCSILIDEAANLPSRARDYYSPEIRLSWVKHLLGDNGCPADRRKLLEPWIEGFREWENLLQQNGKNECELPQDTALLLPLDRWMNHFSGMKDPPDELRKMFRSILDFSKISESPDTRFHLLFRMEENDSTIQWFCTDPSEYLAERLRNCHSAVAFSATLSPFEHFRDQLGFPDEQGTAYREVIYPFPGRNLGVWIDSSIDTRYRSREESATLLSERLRNIYSAMPGTWLVFFPSYAYLDLISGFLEGSRLPVLLQTPGMTRDERAVFISRIESGNHLVFTVSGGIFAEGIDLRSETLLGAIIVGPALPGMDLRLKLLSDSFTRRDKDGFLHACAIPGMVRVIQAAGRLIRNEKQRRVIILMGRRFTRYPYVELLPAHWFSDGSIRLLSGGLDDIIKHLN